MASRAHLVILPREHTSQAIVLKITLGMRKEREANTSKRKEGLPLLPQVPHISRTQKSQIHPRGPLKRHALCTNAKGTIVLGEGQDNWRSLKKEGRT